MENDVGKLVLDFVTHPGFLVPVCIVAGVLGYVFCGCLCVGFAIDKDKVRDSEEESPEPWVFFFWPLVVVFIILYFVGQKGWQMGVCFREWFNGKSAVKEKTAPSLPTWASGGGL